MIEDKTRRKRNFTRFRSTSGCTASSSVYFFLIQCRCIPNSKSASRTHTHTHTHLVYVSMSERENNFFFRSQKWKKQQNLCSHFFFNVEGLRGLKQSGHLKCVCVRMWCTRLYLLLLLLLLICCCFLHCFCCFFLYELMRGFARKKEEECAFPLYGILSAFIGKCMLRNQRIWIHTDAAVVASCLLHTDWSYGRSRTFFH